MEAFRQLLRVSWYPATLLNPETCATFEALELFHMTNLQGNLTVYDFYKALEMLTDGWQLHKLPVCFKYCFDHAGSNVSKDREQAFAVMVREWRDLQKLLRSGRGHMQDGISSTQPGELAIQCRACPHPGINIPANFTDIPKHLQYLYWLNIAVDCNFRLKNRHRPTNNIDVRLSPGRAYVVDHEPYLEHVRQFASQEEVRLRCSITIKISY